MVESLRPEPEKGQVEQISENELALIIPGPGASGLPGPKQFVTSHKYDKETGQYNVVGTADESIITKRSYTLYKNPVQLEIVEEEGPTNKRVVGRAAAQVYQFGVLDKTMQKLESSGGWFW
eukprot:gnl/TRDRNA2_/TRDRNA2_72379_c0_seq2.p1 gnl/TRDRNA2_/TRDRNA2_72379_c0~~gnl/TRDRNA2_/TRDRNA2_72379_c0_seq2.p1  ORF type:complete len:121 (-),score=17.90 gnl/TRDRNA2_/TRDRNA2_72379_c0_seq2:325-687(-)